MEETRETYTRTMKLGHDCEAMCGRCNGSGEGMADGSSCSSCKGSGSAFNHGWVEEEFEVQWSKPDFSDLEITDGPGSEECEACGMDYKEALIEELRCEAEKTKNSVEICLKLV